MYAVCMSEKLAAIDVSIGDTIIHNSQLCRVTKKNVVKPGKGGAFAQIEMISVKGGTKYDVRFRTEDKIDKAFIETQTMTFAYKDGVMYVFINEEGDELRIQEHELGIRHEFLEEGMQINGMFFENTLLGLSYHQKAAVVCKIMETEHHLKGSTVTAKDKPAVLENGLKVMVPGYVDNYSTIEINPNDVSFIRVVS